jgi:hypothetical protein
MPRTPYLNSRAVSVSLRWQRGECVSRKPLAAEEQQGLPLGRLSPDPARAKFGIPGEAAAENPEPKQHGHKLRASSPGIRHQQQGLLPRPLRMRAQSSSCLCGRLCFVARLLTPDTRECNLQSYPGCFVGMRNHDVRKQDPVVCCSTSALPSQQFVLSICVS